MRVGTFHDNREGLFQPLDASTSKTKLIPSTDKLTLWWKTGRCLVHLVAQMTEEGSEANAPVEGKPQLTVFWHAYIRGGSVQYLTPVLMQNAV